MSDHRDRCDDNDCDEGIDLCACDGCGKPAVRDVDDLDWVDGDQGMRFCPRCADRDYADAYYEMGGEG